MGGHGSGWERKKKTTVEDCWILSVGLLQREKWLQEGLQASGELIWTRNGEKVASVGYEVNTIDAPPWLRLHYTLRRAGEAVDYRVHLTTTPLSWRGVRWAFLCPGVGCERTCRKLYLPPGGRYFACRLCYRLTYTSVQEAHQFEDMYCRLGTTRGKWKRLLEQERKRLRA